MGDGMVSGEEQSCSVIDIKQDHLVLNIADSAYVPSASVFEVVQYWPTVPTASAIQELVPITVEGKDDAGSGSEHRKRNQKRPFSPNVEFKKKPGEKRKRKVPKKHTLKVSDSCPAGQEEMCAEGVKFSCAKCQSAYVVNPSRRRGHGNKQRRAIPRRVFDPEANKVLLLCNSCGLAMVRAKNKSQVKNSTSQESNSEEGKTEYLRTASQFASLLAEKLNDAEAQWLYCPAFKVKSCGCLQNFINGTDENSEEAHQRAIYVLNIMKEARKLAAEKTSTATISEDANIKITTNKYQSSGSVKLRRSAKYENFVLTTRRYFKEQLKMCEKACQRVLHYSNNFLHKRLKTLPGKNSRMVKTLGRRRQGSLVAVSQLAAEHCCADKCVLMALTHSRLLETWRSSVELGQRAARRVLAEMLTPSGGAKSNCYKFISMVTGCSLSTICSVADQMRRSQGEREPLEHGLKKWWREHPRQVNKSCGPPEKSADEDDGQQMSALDIHIPSAEELQLLAPEEASRQLQEQRDKLAHLQKQVIRSQRGGPKHVPRHASKKVAPQRQPVVRASAAECQQHVVHVIEDPHPGTDVLDPTGNVGLSLPPQATSGSNIIIVQDNSEGVPVRYCAESRTGPIELMKTAIAPSLPSVIMVQSSVSSSDGYQVFNVVDSSGTSVLQYS